MKIRTRIFLVFVLVIAAGFYVLVQWIGDDLRPRYLESVEESLVDTVNILAELLVDEFAEQSLDIDRLQNAFERVYQRRIAAQIYAVEKRDIDMRAYVTDNNGVVLFDSSGRDVGADYSRWNDVYRTLKGEYGARASNEDPSNPVSVVLYIAAPVLLNGEIAGVVSVGKPARNVDRFLEVAKSKLLTAGIVAAAIVLLVGLVLSVWVSRPLEQLIRYARAVKQDKRVVLPKLGRNEIGMMGEAMEEMRQELAGRDYAQRYVQSLTHEFKSPLAAIRGAAELLDEEMPAAERKRFLHNIRNQSQRLHELVERLLELAALENRQVLENVETIQVNELLQDASNSLAPLAVKQQVVIKQDIAAKLLVRGEHFLLRQAIVNLLRNAISFSSAGDEVLLTARNDGKSVELSVSDAGPGIPDYALERIFERFYSLPRPNGGSKSTGLGLSFVKEIAELHGGIVTLQNTTPGVTATLRLPVFVST